MSFVDPNKETNRLVRTPIQTKVSCCSSECDKRSTRQSESRWTQCLLQVATTAQGMCSLALGNLGLDSHDQSSKPNSKISSQLQSHSRALSRILLWRTPTIAHVSEHEHVNVCDREEKRAGKRNARNAIPYR